MCVSVGIVRAPRSFTHWCNPCELGAIPTVINAASSTKLCVVEQQDAHRGSEFTVRLMPFFDWCNLFSCVAQRKFAIFAQGARQPPINLLQPL